MNSAQGHSPYQTWNFGRGQQVGLNRYVGSLCQRYLLLPVGSPQKILEALLTTRNFLGIGLGSHKCVVIRAERRRGPGESSITKDANQPDQEG